MRKKLRGGPALVIAVLALFVALGGGYAIGAGFIGTGDLKNQAVTNKKIKKKTIKANRVKPDTLTGDRINEASLDGAPAPVCRSRRSRPRQVPAIDGDSDRADAAGAQGRAATCSSRRRCSPRAEQIGRSSVC